MSNLREFQQSTVVDNITSNRNTEALFVAAKPHYDPRLVTWFSRKAMSLIRYLSPDKICVPLQSFKTILNHPQTYIFEGRIVMRSSSSFDQNQVLWTCSPSNPSKKWGKDAEQQAKIHPCVVKANGPNFKHFVPWRSETVGSSDLDCESIGDQSFGCVDTGHD